MIECLHTLNSGYQRGAVWIFHRDAVRQIRKLKDGEGNYLWNPGLSSNVPMSILDKPYYMSEYAPNTFTSGNYVGIVGDFSYYWIVDALEGPEILRLNELYASSYQVGYLCRTELDAMPILESAFVRVTLA